ncbi:hypothetical protein HYC85_010034 [Camellia sinensis]|uniref:non-specific serine/threonine protein kinase n=1 Tax=Camellia sinensis TaxID=4442 RepID=A0A7J7HGQ7_CAMSI|nr:hypothetical protein HYC85_010034 [Camellia sinensis]
MEKPSEMFLSSSQLSCCSKGSQKCLDEHTTQLGWVRSMWQLGWNSMHQFLCHIYSISEHGCDWSVDRRHSAVVRIADSGSLIQQGILVGCGFSGLIPDTIGSLQQLRILSLNSNSFIGPIPPSIGNLSNLYWLDLADNKLSGTIPVSSGTTPGLDMLVNTKHLLFDSNQLSGSIPSTLGLVQTLEVLRLDRNSLSGPVPPNITNLMHISDLYLSNNQLTGPLPNLTGMNFLNYMDLSNNTFDVSNFPPWLSALQSLTTLVMENTRLQGLIPVALFSLPQLQTVVLSYNQLNGTLDVGSSYSNELQLIDLQNNSIVGFTQRAGFSIDLILVGNPVCGGTGGTETYCVIQQSNSSYSTPKNCIQTTTCRSDEISSPNCRCEYPYMGTLFFRAPSFSSLGNGSIYIILQNSLMNSFQSHQLPVDSVSLSNPSKNSDDYFVLSLEVFPSGQDHFNRTGVYWDCVCLEQSNFQASQNVWTLFLHWLTRIGSFAASWGPSNSSGGVPQLKGARFFSFEELKKYTNNFSEANNIGSGGYGKVYRGTLPTGQLIAIKRAQQGSMQGGVEFKTEIELLSRVHHKNVVSLLGFCFDQGEQMLVYEYVPNGTLMESLSGKSGIRLDWMRRLRMAIGAARGLQYLHELADPPIIHRDIKSNNILLDERLNAKVADFGLSKPMGDAGKGHVSTQVKGTMGYLDPEYYMSQQLTEKSDVYSFGVLLLELITARQPIEKGKYIVREVRMQMDKEKVLYNLHEILDRAILGTTLKGLEKFVDLALSCVEDEGVKRPTMGEVVKEIETIMQIAGVNPNADSATSSANYEGASREHNHPYGDEDSL